MPLTCLLLLLLLLSHFSRVRLLTWRSHMAVSVWEEAGDDGDLLFLGL